MARNTLQITFLQSAKCCVSPLFNSKYYTQHQNFIADTVVTSSTCEGTDANYVHLLKNHVANRNSVKSFGDTPTLLPLLSPLV